MALMTKTILVVGANGATGKHVVRLLLEQGHYVRTIVRSKARMESLLPQNLSTEKLGITEASVTDLPDERLKELTNGCDGIVSCLGHNLTFSGIWGKPRDLVTSTTMRLMDSASPKTKFVLMSSNGVTVKGREDRTPTSFESAVMWLLRHLIPPHADNETAAAFLHDTMTKDKESCPGWVAVRPSDLLDGDVSEYTIHEQSLKGPFGDRPTTRANVAHFMVRLVTDDGLWSRWKYGMPVILNQEEPNKK